MKPIINMFLIVCMLFVSTGPVDAITYDNFVPVYTIDEFGNTVKKMESIELYSLNNNNSNNIARVIPNPGYGSIRISDISYGTTNILKTIVTHIAGILYGVAEGKLFLKTGGKSLPITRYIYNQAYSKAVDSIMNLVTRDKYTAVYFYAQWSNYYNAYVVFLTTIVYNDSGRTQVHSVVNVIVSTQSKVVAYNP